MAKIYEDNSFAIGNTPLVKLKSVTKNAKATVLAKIEGRNPAYSVKCRIGANMIWDAEKSGKLTKDKTIVEPTSGNTGIALAFTASARGYKLILTMPESMSIERRRVMAVLGAEIVLTEASKGMPGAIAKAKEIAESNPSQYFMPGQFDNPANPEIHFKTTGPEIWDDCDGEIDVFVAGVMQHIEEAGIHSGDSACCMPPVAIKKELIDEINNQTKKLALALKVKGFMNVQFAIKNDEIYIIEVNPRASRTVPFVSKAKGIPLAKIASRIMAGEKLKKFNLKDKNKNIFAVKEAVFPFNKFPNVDVLLGPEMKSTGEVMGIDKDFGLAYAKSQMASQNSLPTKGLAFISLKDRHKNEGVDLAKQLIKLGFTLCGTEGTANRIIKNGIKCKKINKVSGGSPHIIDVLNSKKIALVINTGGGKRAYRIQDSTSLRRSTLINKVPYCTNMSTAYAFLEAIKSLKTKKIEVKSLQEI